MLSLKSPAKINLFLRILGRRTDGYHELASLFQTIDLCDRMRFDMADRESFTCSDPALPTDETNLVSRAVCLFRRKTGVKTPFSIHLQKNIPQQAGLGGGSSNAATTLWALNHLCGKPAEENELVAWAAEIGSDISFFLSQGTAYCTGRGEILKPLPALKKCSISIVKPLEGLSTPEVYKKLNLGKAVQETPATLSLQQSDPEAALASFYEGETHYFNDLEPPAFEVMPELAILKKNLINSGFSHVLMSGSGSSFFCVGDGNLADFSHYFTFKTHYINRLPGHWY